MTTIPIENFGRAPAGWEECSICYDTSKTVQNITGHQPRIGDRHGFHADCLAQWINTGQDNCPTCRTAFERKVTVLGSIRRNIQRMQEEYPEVLSRLREIGQVTENQVNDDEQHELPRAHIKSNLAIATAICAYGFSVGYFPSSFEGAVSAAATATLMCGANVWSRVVERL